MTRQSRSTDTPWRFGGPPSARSIRAYAVSLNNLARVLEATGRYAEAEPLYQQAVEIVRTALGDEHPNTRRVAGNYRRLLRARFPDNPVLAELNAVLGEDVNED